MIYTVTANPSLDYLMELPQGFTPGGMNRAANARIVPGGKGINVSIMLSRLQTQNQALGFTGGFSGREITRLVAENGCQAAFIELPDALSRINVKLRAQQETEINAPGPVVPRAAVMQLHARVAALDKTDTLVLAGAAPRGAPDGFYAQLLRATPSGVLTVLDAAGEQLRQALACRPFLIKPNAAELGDLCGWEVRSEYDVLTGVRALQAMGARNVLASMGKQGGMLLTEDGRLMRGFSPPGKPVNTVGAGDSMVAGFLAGWQRTKSLETALRMGLATGSATAFHEWLAECEDVERCYHRLPPIRIYHA